MRAFLALAVALVALPLSALAEPLPEDLERRVDAASRFRDPTGTVACSLEGCEVVCDLDRCARPGLACPPLDPSYCKGPLP